MAKSIISDGDLWLDEYRAAADSRGDYGLRKKRQGKILRLYSLFPFGTAFLISPAIWIYERYPDTLCTYIPRASCERGTSAFSQKVLLEEVLASAIVALSGLCLFIAARRVSSNIGALASVMSFYFLSSSWSLVSRGLWQHGPSMLMLSCTLVLLTSPRLKMFAGIPLGWAYLIRPTNAISIAVVGLYFLVTRKLKLSLKPNLIVIGGYILLVMTPVLILIYWSWCNLGRILPTYYSGNRLALGFGIFNGIGVNLISPSRGLLVFTPILLLCFFSKNTGIFRTPLNRAVLGAIILHLIAVSAFPEWWAGHSYGPRYMSDMLPYLFFLFAQLISTMSCQKYFTRVAVAGIILASFTLHYQGANNLSLWMWNKHPREISSHPYRVWNIRDSQVVRALVRPF
jgi:hypothetical protein